MLIAPEDPRRRMKISAVISTWNRRDDVAANVAALKAGTRPPDEIVVVDNASTDGTAERLEAHGVGYLAPVTTNTTEAGRTLNRRVELVLR